MQELLFIFFGGLLLGGLLGRSWFAGSDAPYIPTKKERIKKILKLSGLKKGAIFYELGSGDGRVVLEAAKIGAHAYGIEQSWIRVLLSRWKAKKLPNAHFIHGDIFKNPLKNTDIVFIFLLPQGVNKLEPLLRKNLKKGAKVITQTFHFNNWKPYKKILVTDKLSINTPLGKNKLEGEFWIYKVS